MKKIIPNLLAQVDALFLLERLEDESVDLVYLDPPWNTASAFSFGVKKESEVKENQETYQEYLYKVLQQSFRILKDTGNLVVYSEPRMNLDLQPVITKVFGEQNYVQEFILPQRNTMHSNFSQTFTTILCYRKSPEHVFNTSIGRSAEEIKKLFPYSDQRGAYRTITLTTPIESPSRQFTWKDYSPLSKTFWKYSEEKLNKLFEEGRIEIRGSIPRLKQYLNETNDTNKKIHTIWDDIEVKGRRFPNDPYSQPELLLERILRISTNPGALIVDPFCGTGTSLVVASQLNRQWIGADNLPDAISIVKDRELSSFKFRNREELSQMPVKWNDYELLFQTLEELILQIITEGENRYVEFKESAAFNYRTGKEEKGSLSRNILEAIVSFLNCEHIGTLFIGVRDDKSLVDLSLHDFAAANKQKRNEDGYERFLNDKIVNQLGVKARDACTISFHRINDCEICMIKISPSKRPIFFEGNFLTRNGGGKRKLTNEEFFEIMQDRFQLI